MFTNEYFWLSVALCLLGYFLFRFGMISRGAQKEVIEFVGGLLLLSAFGLVIYVAGWKGFLVLLIAFWFVVTPLVETFIPGIYERLIR